MFERIRRADLSAERKQTIFLIVPDQFTLEAERGAFAYLNVPAFMNPAILSMNRLAGKVLSEAGAGEEHIDRYGNYMLLARLLYRGKESLTLYRNLENSPAFIAQLSETIMSLKAHLKSPEDLSLCASAAEAGGSPDAGELLGKKLRDVASVYTAYEESLAAALPDTPARLRQFAVSALSSKLLENAIVWIYGFDYFSPLHLNAIGAMAARAAEVNVVLTAGEGVFSLTGSVAESLAAAAKDTKTVSVLQDADRRGIDCSYLPKDAKPAEIARIESVFAGASNDPDAGWGERTQFAPADPASLRFVAAQNYYSEAEAAAQEIMRLVRDEGFRYRDILVVCNDQERRAPAIERIFSAYGIPAFLDKRHEAGFSPVLAYITALPEIVSRGRRAEDVMRWIGSGLTDVGDSDAEELDNYIERYGLRGGAWQKPLTRGEKAYDEETFARISNTVKYAGGMISRFAARFSGARDVRTRTEGLKAFLLEDAHLPEKIEAYAQRLEIQGFLDYAGRMRGVWNAALEIFTQIETALGGVVTGAEEYATILRVGFSSVMMGVLPASSDAVTVGTMQRTRTGLVKAMFVLGANDGELPMFAEDEGLFDDTEREALEKYGLIAFRREQALHDEEELAIYKNFSKPTRLLWLSHTAFGPNGKDRTEPSRVFGRLRALFPDTPLENANTLIRESLRPRAGCTDAPVRAHYAAPLGDGVMQTLIPQTLSPSAIEKYSRCPFSFLMDRGLHLREIRKHEIDSRGMGDVYHETLRRFGDEMNARGGAPVNTDSAWNTASRAETDDIVDKVFREMEEGILEAAESRHISDEGALLFSETDPAAVYRRERLLGIVKDVCSALTGRARESAAERIIFEQNFGKGDEFDEVQIAGQNGGLLRVSGRIDRIDVLADGKAKVLDYKSGADRWNEANIRSGWQLQLMLYLKAIESAYDPSGVSYFRLFEPKIDISGADAKLSREEIETAVMKQYRSDGAAVGDPERKKTADGEKILTVAQFDDLRKAANGVLEQIAENIAKGEVSADPKQNTSGDRVTACTYCSYKSICNYLD